MANTGEAPKGAGRLAVDALGHRPERRGVFTPSLLAETPHEELDLLVKRAAAAAETPIALVSLVLDHIQYFRAHTGLPQDLASMRATSRDTSFCQFVVRDGVHFEVTDADSDERVPKYVVNEYGIKSYLGYPLRVGDVVVGSLCVLDVKAREFTQTEHEELEALSREVEEQVVHLASDRRRARLALTDEVSAGAISEMRAVFQPILDNLSDALPALTALRSTLRHYQHVLLDGNPTSEQISRSTHAAGLSAFMDLESVLADLDANSVDCADTLLALELLGRSDRSPPLIDIVLAAQDLARAATREVGGANLPELPEGVRVAASQPTAIALFAAALNRVAHCANRHDVRAGLTLSCHQDAEAVDLGIACAAVPQSEFSDIVDALRAQVGEDPSFAMSHSPDAISIRLRVSSAEN